jgi:nucleotide-binding universal stress UspA family protein
MFARILCPIAGAAGDRRALDAAASLALAFSSHVEVLHARPDPTAFVPYLGEGMSPGAVEALIGDAERRAEESERRASEAFASWSRERGVAQSKAAASPRVASCSWRREDGAEDFWIARRGRLADLVVVAAPGGEASVAATAAAEAALLDTGRPVLLAPSAPVVVAGVAVVAWNGSQQAARAVGAALPLLARAREVHVVTIEEAGRPADPTDLAEYLAWHGVAARARMADRDAAGIAATIDAACTQSAAALLVMGAYTHSRVRELIFGGVTAHTLRDCRIPTLLAH